MAEKKKEPEEDDKCTHPLMCEEEWKDPEGAQVIAEYHKDVEGSEEEKMIEEDLDAFESYWQRKHGINFQGEYHKEGAPYMEQSSGWDGHQPRGFSAGAMGEPPSQPVSYEKPESGTSPLAPRPPSAKILAEEAASIEHDTFPKPSKEKGEPLKLTEVVDINTLEVVSYWIFRLAFGKELHVPIKKEGVADLDIHFNNKDIIVNTNQLYFVFPELVVWHITYTHKGRPVLEIGRGVKKGMKVHRINAFRLLMEVWMGSRRAEKDSKAAEMKSTIPIVSPSQRKKDAQDLKEKGDIT